MRTELAPNVPNTRPQFNKDPDMVENMELDLIDRVKAAMEAAGISTNVFGVFSLDDMENKQKSDICASKKIAVGVGYMGSKARPKAQGNVDTGTSRVSMVDFQFVIILAVPSGVTCEERFSATKLLTVLRLAVLGTSADPRKVQRSWEFMEETPNIRESDEEMLYYAQVWRMSLTNTGNN